MIKGVFYTVVVASMIISTLCGAYAIAGELSREAIRHAGQFAMTWAGLSALAIAWAVTYGKDLEVSFPSQVRISIPTAFLITIGFLVVGFAANATWNPEMKNLFLGVYGMFGSLALGGACAFHIAGFRLTRKQTS
ncbi:hypothetical protein [Marinobacter salarius]|uniref:Uncharacterized protein n=1 Tax=Marinobacter salarius TaxID=1420917 RepID=A0A1W6KG08_9GAMM|nr:hypothetical protein [Marinobacter salarius]ARM86366.1 hypothetical protein MARSALSMR5_04349 [Marinobacter salarius]